MGMTAELSVLKDEIAWCKTQMAGLVDYEAEISNKLAAVSAERDRLQGENFTLRVEIKRLQGLVVEGGASVGDT